MFWSFTAFFLNTLFYPLKAPATGYHRRRGRSLASPRRLVCRRHGSCVGGFTLCYLFFVFVFLVLANIRWVQILVLWFGVFLVLYNVRCYADMTMWCLVFDVIVENSLTNKLLVCLNYHFWQHILPFPLFRFNFPLPLSPLPFSLFLTPLN